MSQSMFVYTKRKENGMYGLFANVNFEEGDEILDIQSGDKQAAQDFRSIELDDGHYTHPDGMFVNHSCDPSAFISKWSGTLVANRPIEQHGEITFDYLSTETTIVGPFECKCGAENCVGSVKK